VEKVFPIIFGEIGHFDGSVLLGEQHFQIMIVP
jgi:hypothetical protein